MGQDSHRLARHHQIVKLREVEIDPFRGTSRASIIYAANQEILLQIMEHVKRAKSAANQNQAQICDGSAEGDRRK